MSAPKVALRPSGVRSWLGEAVVAGGGEIVEPPEAEALVWADSAGAAELSALLSEEGRAVRWVQLPWAGIEPFVEVVRQHPDRAWSCGKGVYAEPVAEHALALLLAGLRAIGRYARRSEWSEPEGTNLLGGRVVVLGGGGIARSLLRLLKPFGVEVVVVRRSPEPMDGADRVVPLERLDEALDGAIGVVVALALTPETTGVIGARQLEAMHPRGWLVNVGRGAHVVADDLLAALEAGTIGGAALDVTDPEPLPAGHPLWNRDDVIITPHVANTPEMAMPLLAGRVTENVRRWGRGDPLLGPVDPARGY